MQMLDLTIQEASDFSIRTLEKGTPFPVIPNKKKIKSGGHGQSSGHQQANTTVNV
jgi:hypothetical protein